MIITWDNDGTKTAGSLTKDIMDLINIMTKKITWFESYTTICKYSAEITDEEAKLFEEDEDKFFDEVNYRDDQNLERAKFEKETAIGVATEITKLKLPEVYMGSAGSGGNAGMLESLIGADIARQMRTGGK